MTREQFSQAVAMARAGYVDADTTPMHGCALPGFEPVYVTIPQVAALIRWQCLQLNGQMDGRELDSMARLARRRFLIV